MNYLLNQILFYLLFASIAGAIFGWLLTKFLGNKEWQTRHQSLRANYDSTRSALDDYKKKTHQQTATIQQLTSRLALKDRDNHILAKSLVALQKQRKDLKQKETTLNQELTRLQTSHTELVTRSTQLDNKLAAALKENRRIRGLENTLADLNQSCDNLQENLFRSQAENKAAIATIDKLSVARQTLQDENKRLQSLLDNTSAKAKEARNALNKERADLQLTVQQLKQDNTKLSTTVKHLKESAQNLQHTQQRVETLSAEKNKLHTDLKAIQQTASSRKQQIREQASQIATLGQEKKAATDELKRYQDYLIKKEARWAKVVKQLRHQIDVLASNRKADQKKAQEITTTLEEKLQRTIYDHKDQYTRLESRYKEAQNQYTQVQQQQLRLQAKLEAAQKEAATHQQASNQLREQLQAECKLTQNLSAQIKAASKKQALPEKRNSASPTQQTPNNTPCNQNARHLTAKMATVNKEEKHPQKDRKTKAIPDDLTLIKGIGKANEKILHNAGITTFAQIAQFTPQDEKKYGKMLHSFPDRISQEEWVKQARALLTHRPV